MGNQTPDEGCLSRATIGSRGISLISDGEICPACPDPVGEEHRDEGPLFISDKDSSPARPEHLGEPRKKHPLVPSAVVGFAGEGSFFSLLPYILTSLLPSSPTPQWVAALPSGCYDLVSHDPC